jgi:hypothetical protein
MPLVSIVILTYNRINVLIDVIRKLKQLTYKNIEIIIVNNNSSDETKDKIPELFPDINLINLEKNIGVSALNYGLKAAKGEFILQLDDDSYPEDSTIEAGLNEFYGNKKLGIVAFKVINLRYNICETNNFPVNPRMFNGCGVMFRTAIFEKSGYYNKNIFIYYNELDLSIRVFDKGYEIKYLNDAPVYHLQAPSGRVITEANPFISEFRYYHYFLSYYIFLYTYFNKILIIKYTIKLLLSNLLKAIYFGYYKSFFIALFKIIKFSFTEYDSRIKISGNTQKYYDNGNFAFIDRMFFPNIENNKFYKWIKGK